MKITKVVVMVHTHSTDLVFLETDLPSPFPPSLDTSPLRLRFEVTAGKGIEYAREHFGLEPEIMDMTEMIAKAKAVM